MRTRIFVFISCFGFLTASFTHALAYPASIVRVMDGDTMIVELGAQSGPSFLTPHLLRLDWFTSGPSQRTIRLYGIDCPENKQAYGDQAAKLTRTFYGQKVDVQDIYTDSYGRSVAVLRLDDGSILQEHLLRSGAAWLYSQYCKASICGTWKRLEQEARGKRLGLWADECPTAPWNWRKTHKNTRE